MQFPNGAVFGFSTVTAASVTASAVSNASPAVATVPTGSFAENDVVIIQSSWPVANNRAAKVGDVTTGASDTAQLLGISSTNTSLCPAGQASMKLAKASSFVDFSNQDGAGVSTSGGEQQFWTGQLLEDPAGSQIQVPTFKNAKVLTIPLFFDPDATWYEKAQEIDFAKEPVVLRCKLPGGDELYRYGYLSFDGDPSIAANTPMGNTATFTALGATTLVRGA